ncbi:MAG: sialate O-acetylesterase [Opitutus sp.]|nr:sialate O-acetylesterase [Opitutus sp.]
MVLFVSAASAAEPAPRDIFLLIGQSNMAGRGVVEAEDKVPHPRILAMNQGKAWVPAVDPLHFDKLEIAGVGLGSTFAREVAKAEPGAVIGLIPAAFGGTSLDEWAPDGKLYANAVERARLALGQGGKLRAILWHQGEADRAAEKMASYPKRFAALAARLRLDLNAPDVPIIAGELFNGRPENGPMNAMLGTLGNTVTRYACVAAKDLKDKGDQTHFESASVREFGRRYAGAFFQLTDRAATKKKP